MTFEYDLVVRGGRIVDGSGGAPYTGDVAITGDRIAAIGRVAGTGRDEIDAAGMLVTPGFVDIHSHFDGQAIWESRLQPSSGHGVTTVVMGNCGVGFAPCRAEDRTRLVELMEGVEDIPGVVMTTGLSWDWETYPEYLDAVDSRPHDINLASLLPHSAVRVYVMGERASAYEQATAADLDRMAQLTEEAMRAGAVGFGTSRTLFHRSSKGDIVPTADAGGDELLAIAKAMGRGGAGVIQIANDYKNQEDIPGEFAMMVRLVRESGRPLSLPTVQMHGAPRLWQDIMARIRAARADGVHITAQTMPRGVGMLLGLELTMHPFTMCPSYAAIADLPLAERVARMRDPDLRARLVSEEPGDPSHPLVGFVRNFDGMYAAGDPIDYEPEPENAIAARAARQGITAAEFAYDLLLERDGQAMIYLPFTNYAEGNLDVVGELMADDHVVLGLADGGAHLGVICDASYSTFVLTHWTRDRTRGARFPVERAVKMLAADTAAHFGFHDRGVLRPGYKADLNVIDYDRLTLHAPTVRYDLPANGRRLTQKADGYIATIVNGQVVYRDGEATGLLPGTLVRGPQPAPAPLQ
jgi:N-acyl-D-amino-acid deacylase